MKRRLCVQLIAAVAGAGLRPVAAASNPKVAMTVYRSPYCGCCGAWVEHVRAAGFELKVVMVDDTTAERQRLGLPDRFGSCHTAVVAGYVIEGHVPAEQIKRLLALRPAALGLAVPSMPPGSPGMEQPDGRSHPYEVLLIDKKGREQVFARYPQTPAATQPRKT